jgi:hypothetical protein
MMKLRQKISGNFRVGLCIDAGLVRFRQQPDQEVIAARRISHIQALLASSSADAPSLGSMYTVMDQNQRKVGSEWQSS